MRQGSPEELLLRCLRAASDKTEWERLCQLPEPAWEAIAQLAIKHGIASPLFHHLQPIASAIAMPTGALQRLRDAYLANIARNLYLYKALHHVLTALADASIPVIVLKGAYLAQAVYGNVGLRSMSDMDLLVHKNDLPKVGDILQSLNYAAMGDDDQVQRALYHSIYRSEDETTTVEVHWHIQTPGTSFHIDLEGLWKRARPGAIAGVNVLVLCPEDTLLHVCLHSAAHHFFRWFGLRSLYDMATICQRWQHQLDWPRLSGRAHEWGIANATYLALRLAKDLLDAAIPESVLQALVPGNFDPRLVHWAVKSLFANVTNRETDPASWSDQVGELWASHRLTDRVAAVLRACFPPLRRLAQLHSLPADSRWLVFYYPVHLLNLLRQRGRIFWLLLRRDEDTIAWADREAGRVALMKWLTSPRQQQHPAQRVGDHA